MHPLRCWVVLVVVWGQRVHPLRCWVVRARRWVGRVHTLPCWDLLSFHGVERVPGMPYWDLFSECRGHCFHRLRCLRGWNLQRRHWGVLVGGVRGLSGWDVYWKVGV